MTKRINPRRSLSPVELAAVEERIRRLRAWAARTVPMHSAAGGADMGDPVGGGDPDQRNASIDAAAARAVALAGRDTGADVEA